MNSHYEATAKWMQKNIPPGELIYHPFWSDSPYFMCFNPKNNYISVLDPIYMFYRYPKEFLINKDLYEGRFQNPQEVLGEVFKVTYGYARKSNPLYAQIENDPAHFEILYRDNGGAVFKLLKP